MEMSFADAKSTFDRIIDVENVGISSNSARRTDAQSNLLPGPVLKAH